MKGLGPGPRLGLGLGLGLGQGQLLRATINRFGDGTGTTEHDAVGAADRGEHLLDAPALGALAEVAHGARTIRAVPVPLDD